METNGCVSTRKKLEHRQKSRRRMPWTEVNDDRAVSVFTATGTALHASRAIVGISAGRRTMAPVNAANAGGQAM